VEAGIPFVTVKNIVSGVLDLSETKFVSHSDHLAMTKRVRPEPGDVLVSKDGTIGVPCVIPEGVQPFSIFVSVALLKLRRDIADPIFLSEQIKTDLIQKQIRENSKGIAIRHLHLSDFAKLRFLLPPMEAQMRFRSVVSRVHELNGRMAQYSKGDQLLFSSLQHRAFSGQL
jgi:type I restriction enzyme S subunit